MLVTKSLSGVRDAYPSRANLAASANRYATIGSTKIVIQGLCIVIASSFAGLAQAKPTIELPLPGEPGTPGQQLQQIVNDPTNVGVKIRLARGTYVLDPAEPNGGRLLLQPGMQIVGENQYVDCDGDSVWDPVISCVDASAEPAQFTLDDSETIIDGTAITSALGGASVVRVGRNNLISHVTIRAPRLSTVGGSLDINLVDSSGNIRAVVRDSILEGGQRGIRCNNGSPPRSGISAFATIERNIMRDNVPVPGRLFGFAMQIQNSNASESSWNVNLHNNRMMASRFGLFVAATRAHSFQTMVHSSGNLIHDNDAGALIMAAFAPLGGPAGDSSSDNVFRIDSMNDSYIDNVTPAYGGEAFLNLGGGLMAFAAASDSPISGIHAGNVLDLRFLHSRFEGNVGVDGPLHLTIAGYLASSLSGPDIAVDNILSLLMRHTITDGEPGSFVVSNEIPSTQLDESNRVMIIGSDVAFEQTNPDFELPSQGLFPSSE